MDEFKKSLRTFLAMGLAVFGIPLFIYVGFIGMLLPFIGIGFASAELKYSQNNNYTERESEAKKTIYVCIACFIM